MLGQTGDLPGNINRLVDCLRQIQYPLPVSAKKLREGDPSVLLPQLHFVLLDYSKHVAAFLSEKGYRFFGKDDRSFAEDVFRLLKEEWKVSPAELHLNATQFMAARGFVERKLLLVIAVMKQCVRIHNEAERAHLASRAVFPYTRLTTVVPRSHQPDGVTESSTRYPQPSLKPEWLAKHSSGNNSKGGAGEDKDSLFPREAHPYPSSSSSAAADGGGRRTHVGTQRENQIRSQPFLMMTTLAIDSASNAEQQAEENKLREDQQEGHDEAEEDESPLHPIQRLKEERARLDALEAAKDEAARELQAWEFLSDAVAIGSGASASLFAKKRQAMLDRAVTAPLLARALDVTPAVDAAVLSGFAAPADLPPVSARSVVSAGKKGEQDEEREEAIPVVTVVAAGVTAERLSAPFLVPPVPSGETSLRPVSYQQLLASASSLPSSGNDREEAEAEEEGEPLAPSSSFSGNTHNNSSSSSSNSHGDNAGAVSPSRLPIHRRYLNPISNPAEAAAASAATSTKGDPAAATTTTITTQPESFGAVTKGIEPPGRSRGIARRTAAAAASTTPKDSVHPQKTLFWPAGKAVTAVYSVPAPLPMNATLSSASSRAKTEAKAKPKAVARGTKTSEDGPREKRIAASAAASTTIAPPPVPLAVAAQQEVEDQPQQREHDVSTGASSYTYGSDSDSDSNGRGDASQPPREQAVSSTAESSEGEAEESGPSSSSMYALQQQDALVSALIAAAGPPIPSSHQQQPHHQAVPPPPSTTDSAMASAGRALAEAAASLGSRMAATQELLQRNYASSIEKLARSSQGLLDHPGLHCNHPPLSSSSSSSGPSARFAEESDEATTTTADSSEASGPVSLRAGFRPPPATTTTAAAATIPGPASTTATATATTTTRASQRPPVAPSAKDAKHINDSDEEDEDDQAYRAAVERQRQKRLAMQQKAAIDTTPAMSNVFISSASSSCGASTAYTDDFEAEEEEEGNNSEDNQEYLAALRRAEAKRKDKIAPSSSSSSSSSAPVSTRLGLVGVVGAGGNTGGVLSSATEDFLRQMLLRAKQTEAVIAQAKEAMAMVSP